MKSTNDANIIAKARRWAVSEFKTARHGPLPYEAHNTAVAGLAATYSRDPDVISAAWLHDMVEDHRDQYTIADVRTMTNDRVAYLVDLLTDPPGPRELVKQVSLKRIATDTDAILIKLCDRFTNQHTAILDRSIRHMSMYLREYADFREAMFRPMMLRQDVSPLLYGLSWQHGIMADELAHMAVNT